MKEGPSAPGLTYFNLPPEVETLLMEALNLAPDRRRSYLASATDDPAIRAQVEALLRDHAVADVSLNGLVDNAREVVQAPAADLPFSHAGPWKLVRVLGRGGMSVVYLVERDNEEFEQIAALKLVPTGTVIESLTQRFKAERRILARLEHPNLARLLDGGVSPQGMPWLVMEYVDGLPIDQHCDQHRLNIEQRLELFRQVLEVVQYAHQNLVVHRDLKPSNILVTAEGQVKLLDFGIAKVLDEELGTGDATELTRIGGRPMTLAWSSPEQIAGDTITTASDVYSLGVVLYKLLAGQLPHAHESPAVLEQAIRTQAPAPPSARVGQDEAIAKARSTRPEALARRLRGDLNSIVLTCLRKEPERRYAGVGELLDDLERHLGHQPVRARAPSRRYRLGKFLRRYRLTVAATAAVFALVGAGLAVIGLQARQLAVERDAATREAMKSEQVSAFLLDLFTQGDAWQRQGDEPTLREVIERGADSVASLEATPEVQLHMLSALAKASLSIGDHNQAIALLGAAEDALERMVSHQPGDWVDLFNLQGHALNRAGRFEEAAASHRRALGFLSAGESLARAQTLSNLGVPLRRLNRYEESEQVQREALVLFQQLNPGSTMEAMATNSLAVVLADLDRIGEAREHFEAALALHRRASGPEHPNTLTAMGNLAAFLSNIGDYEAAEPLMMETLALRKRQVGGDHLWVTSLMHALGLLHSRRGDLDQAERWWLEAIDRREATVGADHYSNGPTHHALGNLAMRRGDLDEAERRLLHAKSIYRQAYGGEHRLLARIEFSLGELARQRGDLNSAEARTQRVLDMQHVLFGERHGEIAQTLRRLAEIARDRGDTEAALHFAAQSLAMLESVYENPEHPQTKRTRDLLVSLEVGNEN